MSRDFVAQAFLLCEAGNSVGKAGTSAKVVTVTLTYVDGQSRGHDSPRISINGAPVNMFKTAAQMVLTTGDSFRGWYMECRTASRQNTCYFLPRSGAMPRDGTLAADIAQLDGLTGQVHVREVFDRVARAHSERAYRDKAETKSNSNGDRVTQFTSLASTLIATPGGARALETLRVGDRVRTRDNGLQDIRWVGARGLTGAELHAQEWLLPVRIAKGALGDGFPTLDMYFSPNQRVLVSSDQTALHFEEPKAWVAAKHLTALRGVDIVAPRWITYRFILFERHQAVLSNGVWTECFQPADHSQSSYGNAQRIELQYLFPEFQTSGGLTHRQAARHASARHDTAFSAR